MERRKRRWWTLGITVVSALIVLVSLFSVLFQLAVRAVPGYREQVAAKLGVMLGRPVAIGDVQLTWRGYYASLDLDDVVLQATDPSLMPLTATRLRLAFSLPRLARRDWMPVRVDIDGAELAVERDADGKLHVQGLDDGPDRDLREALEQFARLGRLRLTRCIVVWHDLPLKLDPYRFEITRSDLIQRSGRFEFDLELGLPPELGQSLSVHAELDGHLADPSSWTGPWGGYLRGLTAAPLLKNWLVPGASLSFERARLRLRGELDHGAVPALAADWESGRIEAELGGDKFEYKALVADGDIAFDDSGASLNLQHFELQGHDGAWPETRADFRLQRVGAQQEGLKAYELSASADFLRLQDLAPWLRLIRGVPPQVAALHDAAGDVSHLVLRLRQAEERDQYAIRAELKDLALPSAGRKVGFAKLSGELSANEHGGRLTLRQVPLRLELPKVFDGTVPFDALSGALAWTRRGADWQLQVPDFRWRLLGAHGRGEVAVELPAEGSPRLKLGTRLSAEDATRFKPYIPRQWGKDLHDWLSRAVVSGRVPVGALTIEGPLADFPFNQTNNGVFSLDLDVAGGKLAFHPDWPAVDKMTARLKFRGNSLGIESDGASLLGARIGRIDASIKDFHDARLNLDGEVAGSLKQLYRVVAESPLKQNLGALVRHTRGEGPAQVRLHLEVPLHGHIEVLAEGAVVVNDALLYYNGLKEPIRQINGEIVFGPAGVSSGPLAAQFYEVPVRAEILADTPKHSRLSADFRFAPRADGSGVSELVPGWLRGRLRGESQWKAELKLDGAADSALRLSTDMRGIAVDFPEPMGKGADEEIPLGLSFSADERSRLRIGVEYSRRLGADLRFNEGMTLASALLQVGAGEMPPATEDGLTITGKADTLDLAAWSAALAGMGDSENLTILKRVELEVQKPLLGGQTLLPLRARYTPTADGWQVQLSGEGASGSLSMASGDNRLLRARLQHLALNYQGKDEASAKAETERPPLDPGSWPRFDFDCAQLRIGDVDFGHLRALTERIPDGQKLTQLKVDGGAVDLDASGQWWRRAGQSGANLSFKLGSTQTAEVMQALDYTPNLRAKQSHFEADLLWAPAAGGLELAQTRGQIRLDIENGQLIAIEPGAGRVLGLLNFYALPRRLTLNFRDVLGQGLAFDKITGSFDLADGNARTEDLHIDGPSLKMDTRGRIGLVAKDYDQNVTISPDYSSGVTLGAALLGGPAVGVLVLIAQEVLEKPLDQVTQLSYHLGGTWDNPEVRKTEVIADDAADVPKPKSGPAGGPR
jgi:uncharacterized protein (TIGR02099 family)